MAYPHITGDISDILKGVREGAPPPFQIQKGLKFSIKEFIKSDNDTNKRVGCIITDGD